MMNRKESQKEKAIDCICILVGTAIYALGVHVFTAPNQIAPGGITGLATATYTLTGIPIGFLVSLVNIPLLFVGWRFLGRDFIWKTLLSTVWFTVLTDILFQYIPLYRGNTILAALFGGLLIGAGMALNFIRNGSTGGTDITNRLIQRKFPHLPIGRLVLLSDCVVIAFATFAFRELESALYAIISMVVCSRVVDGIIYGLDVGKMVMIVSDHCERISKAVTEELKRGGTLISAKGAYSGQERQILICALRNNEFYKIKQLVNRLDPKAFIIVANAGEVLGEGFKTIAGEED